MFYILDGKNPVAVSNIDEVKALMGTDRRKRLVRRTSLKKGHLEVDVSTVFLCFDHVPGGDKPVLFETVAFNMNVPNDTDMCTRYNTWDESEAGHEIIVKGFLEQGYLMISDQRRHNDLEEDLKETSRFELMDMEDE